MESPFLKQAVFMSRQKADGKLLDCFFCVVAALPLLGTATGVRHMRSRGRRVDVLVAALARADALVAHGATCSACSGFVLASCSACMCWCCTIAMCVEALDVCIFARCRRSQRAALARPAALCERRLPPRATVVCVSTQTRRCTAHARADCAVCAHADLYGLDTQRTVSNVP